MGSSKPMLSRWVSPYTHGAPCAVTLAGRILTAPTVLACIDGVTAIRQQDEDPD
jgi:hypothetical protein